MKHNLLCSENAGVMSHFWLWGYLCAYRMIKVVISPVCAQLVVTWVVGEQKIEPSLRL